MLISKSEKFLKEYNEFKSAAESVSREDIKKDLQKMISELVVTVKNLDQIHEELFINRQRIDSVSDSKEKIISLRKKIHNKIQECRKAGLIKN